MAITTPPSIDALPTAPNPDDRSTFNQRAYPWSQALDGFTSQANASAQATLANAQSAYDSAVSASSASALASAKSTEAAASAVSALASKAAAEAVMTAYQGALAADPSVNKTGGALKAGDWYTNTTTKSIRAYTGTNWVQSVATSVPDASPVVAGQVNLTSLQQLGAGDKLINGVRIGQGGGARFSNLALGAGAMNSNTSGDYNCAVGAYALELNTTGHSNTAFGYSSMSSSANTAMNTAVGSLTLNLFSSGSQNAAYGSSALEFATASSFNTAIGAKALQLSLSTTHNTALGFYALRDTNTANYCTAVGSGALSSAEGRSNCSGVGYQTQVTGDNQVQLGNASTVTYVYGTVQNRSDERDKADVRDTVLGLDFINALRPVDYRLDMREDYRPDPPAPLPEDATDEQKAEYKQAFDDYIEACKLKNLVHDGSKKRLRYHHGLIAQEVKAVLDAMGIDFGGYQDHKVAGGDDVMTIGYDELIAPLIKAVQQLTARVQALEAAM